MMVRHERKPADVSRFSRRWWIAGLHTLFWVVLVTVLIWIYADMEFTDTAKIIATIKLDTGESGQLELLSRTELPVEFEISGSRSSLEDFQRELDEAGALLSYDVSRNISVRASISCPWLRCWTTPLGWPSAVFRSKIPGPVLWKFSSIR